MSKFEIQCSHLRTKKAKFFNDKQAREYHEFLVINHEIIPNEYLHFTVNRKKESVLIWILDELIKELGINFGDLSKELRKHRFVINFEEKKSAKFNVNNRNWMVLKTKDYFENTIEKIGFWDSNDYFYESVKKARKPHENTNEIELERKINWGKIALFCLPIIILLFFVLLIFKLAVKKKI